MEDNFSAFVSVDPLHVFFLDLTFDLAIMERGRYNPLDNITPVSEGLVAGRRRRLEV